MTTVLLSFNYLYLDYTIVLCHCGLDSSMSVIIMRVLKIKTSELDRQ